MSEDSGPNFDATNGNRPTRIRYLIVAAATLMSFLLYLDRFCVSFAADYIRQDLSLTQNDMKWFLSVFFFSYALAQVPSGWLSDRYGARIMLVIYILVWSLFTGLIGAAYSFFMLISTRLLCGLGQAGAYPTAAGVVKRWVPITARGTASSFVANGGRVGGALAPIMTAYLIVMMVPSDAQIQFQDSDLFQPQIEDPVVLATLPNPYNSIAEQLSRDKYTDKESALRWIQGRLTTEERGLVNRLGMRERQRKLVPAEIAALAPPPSDADKTAMLGMLNRLLAADDLYDRNAMRSINLPREALATLRRLSDDARRNDVTEDERQRFHRFVLEGVFNVELSKFYRKGWRPILYIYGGAGIFVAILFWFVFRERPQAHPWSNKAEVSFVMKGREDEATSQQQVGAVPFKAIVTSGNLWLNCIGQWGTNIAWLFVFTWLPRYLMEVHQVPIIQRGYMTMTPALIGIVGMFCGGRLTDFIAPKLGIKWGRRIPVVSSRFLGIFAYVGAIGISRLPVEHVLNSPWVFTGLFSIVAFSTDFGTAPGWAFMQDVGGRHVGSVLGWGNMWGNLGAFAAPHIYNHFLGENPGLEDWNKMFMICAASFLVTGLCWLKIDATKPVVPEDD